MLQIEKKKRFYTVLALIVITATYFWLESRYPTLNEKAIEANMPTVQDVLTPRPKYQVDQDLPYFKKVYLSWINWVDSNIEGMTFGVLFGSLLMTLFQYIKWGGFKSSYLNALLGLFIGAPLGVCVNCAAPIMVGLLGSRSTITAIAAMIASPSLNIVVLSMGLSILPEKFIWTKILGTLAYIILVLPLIFYFLKEDFLNLKHDKNFGKFTYKRLFNKDTLWADLLSSFYFVFRFSVPLMFLAGLLGALLSHTNFMEMIIDSQFSWQKYFATSFVGTALPVPIGFDIVLSHTLFESGMNFSSTMALLFTLGSYSFYSYFIVWKAISFKLANILFISIMLMGLILGKSIQEFDEIVNIPSLGQGFQSKKNNFSLPKANQPLESEIFYKTESISIEKTLHQKSVYSGKFKKLDHQMLGLKPELPGMSYLAEQQIGTSTSLGAADFDRDGFVDLIDTVNKNIYFYHQRNKTFQRYQLKSPGARLVNLAIVDINNDNFPDLLASTYYQGIFIALNPRGNLSNIEWIQIDDTFGITNSLSFADLDGNGLLDFHAGRSYLSHYLVKGYRRKRSQDNVNSFFFQSDNKNFNQWSYHQYIGETLANLIFKDNNNQWVATEANDFGEPTLFSTINFNEKSVIPFNNQEDLYPGSGMSVDIADFDRNGKIDIIISASHHPQKDQYGLAPEEVCKYWPKGSDCLDHIIFFRKNNFSNKRGAELSNCSFLKSQMARYECLEVLSVWKGIGQQNRQACLKAAKKPFLTNLCKQFFEFNRYQDFKRHSFQREMGRNALFELNEDNHLIKKLIPESLAKTCWSWDMKSADLNHDKWEDLFIANGFAGVVQSIRCPNYLFINKDGELINQNQFFDDIPMMTSSFVYLDWDRDGDLDILIKGPLYPLTLFENQLTQDKSITFDIKRENKPTPYGTKFIITHSDGTTQWRQLLSGRGYVSWDQEIIHFGTKQDDVVKSLELQFPDGSTQSIIKDFQTGYHYSISL